MLDATPIKHEAEQLPFPFNKRAFCRYEPIEKKIDYAKVLIVNDLLRYEDDLSDLAKKENDIHRTHSIDEARNSHQKKNSAGNKPEVIQLPKK